MNAELDELRARIAKLRESDRYLLAELILTDIRVESEKHRKANQAAQLADYEELRAEEAAARKQTPRSEIARAVG